MNHKDTCVFSGSRIEEVGSTFRLHTKQAKGKGTDAKAESVSSFRTSKSSLSPHTEVEIKCARRELRESNQVAREVLDLTGCLDDTGHTDSESSLSTIVFQTPRASVQKVKQEEEPSAWTPPMLRLRKWDEGNTINVDSARNSCTRDEKDEEENEVEEITGGTGAVQDQDEEHLAPHYCYGGPNNL